MLHKRMIALCASAVLTIGGGTAANVVSASRAGATVGTTHHQTGMSNGSAAVEKGAHLTFSCNDVTGAYHVAFTGVQVINPDHVSEWSDLSVYWQILSSDYNHADNNIRTLVQNATNGLFGAVDSQSISGILPDIGACATGSSVFGADNGTFANLVFNGTLT